MNNCGRSLLRAEWSRTAKKLTSWLFGILLVQIRIVGQGPTRRLSLNLTKKLICRPLQSPTFVHCAVAHTYQNVGRVRGGGGGDRMFRAFNEGKFKQINLTGPNSTQIQIVWKYHGTE